MDNYTSREIQIDDIIAYPIHENTKNERLTIGVVCSTGTSLWVEGPEISTTITQPQKCIFLATKSKKSTKAFKKYEDKMSKLNIDDMGFEQYQIKANSIYETFVEKFKEVYNE